MNRYQLLVFDWDGTLMDSEAKIVRCLAAAAVDVGLPVPAESAIRHIIGLGLTEALDTLFPGVDRPRHQALVDSYREHFLHKDQTETPLFPGVDQGLAELTERGFLLAVATGKARRGLDRVLDQTGTRQWFVTTRCADECHSKPHPRMVEEILDFTGTAPARTLVVGDTVYDMEMARNARVAGLAVSYGVHAREQLLASGALGCLDSFAEVCAWLS